MGQLQSPTVSLGVPRAILPPLPLPLALLLLAMAMASPPPMGWMRHGPLPVGATVVSRLSRIKAPSAGDCDYSRGRWVTAPRSSLYTGLTCKHIRSSQNCQRNGRLLTTHLNWRWQPEQPGCGLHRFNPKYFLHRKRNRVVGMVGDSFTANFEDAFRCSIEAVSATQNKEFQLGRHRVYGYVAPEYNFTVLHLPSVFLVKAHAPNGSASNKPWDVHLDQPDPHWSRVLQYLNILVFSTGHWYMNARGWMRRYYVRNQLQPHMSRENALRTALRTIRDHILAQNFSGAPMFITYSPFHYRQAFNSSDRKLSCVGMKRPFSPAEQQVAEASTEAMRLRALQLSVFRRGVAVPGQPSGAQEEVPLRAAWQFRVLDVTRMSLARPDAHVGQYTQNGVPDCSHWCTPGLPDTWADYLYTLLTR